MKGVIQITQGVFIQSVLYAKASVSTDRRTPIRASVCLIGYHHQRLLKVSPA